MVTPRAARTSDPRTHCLTMLGWGQKVASRLRAPDGYTLTAITAVAAAQKVLEGGAQPGYRTPSMAFGADFILEVEGTVREDLPTSTA